MFYAAATIDDLCNVREIQLFKKMRHSRNSAFLEKNSGHSRNSANSSFFVEKMLGHSRNSAFS